MAFTKINAAGIGTTETVTVDGLTVINDGSFGGNLTVSGVLTYEDVTNVDSVGLITARNGIVVGSGITLSKDGDIFATGVTTSTTFSGNFSGGTVAGSTGTFSGAVQSVGLTNTISSGNVIALMDSSNASQNHRVRINSQGASSSTSLVISNSNANNQTSLVHGNDGVFSIRNGQTAGSEPTSGTERLRITSGGKFGFGTDSPYTYGIATFNDSNGIVLEGSSQGRLLFRHTGGGTNLKMFDIQSSSGVMKFRTIADNGTTVTERLLINSSGNVHIGSGDPTIAKLQVSGAGFFGSANTTKTNDGVIIERNSSDGIAHIVAGRSGGNYSGFKFFVAGASGVTLRNEIDYQGNIKWFGADGTTERLRIDSAGRLLLGTTSHTGHALSSSNNPKLQLESNSNADYGRMSFVYNGNDGVGPGLWFGKSRGTSIGSNTVVQNGDQIGGLFFHAADGTDKHSRVAAITAVVDGAPGANDTPGKIVFATCSDGTAATTDRMVINKDGHVTKPYHPAFRAGRNSTQTPGVNGTIVFDYVSSPTHFNQGGHYNTSNGAFTAPVAGVYSFDCQVLFQNLSNGQDMVDAIYFRYNSSGGATGGDLVSYDRRRAEYINGETGQGGYFSTHTSVILDMAAGSSVYVRNQRSGLEVHGNVNYTYFQGYLIG